MKVTFVVTLSLYTKKVARGGYSDTIRLWLIILLDVPPPCPAYSVSEKLKKCLKKLDV